MDLEASANATGRVVAYSIEMGQRMLRNKSAKLQGRKDRAEANLDNVVFEELYAEDVNHHGEARCCV
jgi:hypothetical protein